MPAEQIGFQFDANTQDVLTLNEALGALSTALLVAADANRQLDIVQGSLAKKILNSANVITKYIDITMSLANATAAAVGHVLNLNAAYSTLFASGVNPQNLQLMQQFGQALMFNANAAEAFAIQSAAAAARLEETQRFVGSLFAGDIDAEAKIDALGESVNQLVSGPLQDLITQNEATAASYDWLSAFPQYTEDAEGLNTAMIGLDAGLRLAASSGTDSRTALRGLAQTMQAFDQDAEQAAITAARLNGIVQQGITEFPQFANRIGNLSGAAATAKVEFEEMAGSLAVLTRTMGTDEAITSLENLMLSFNSLAPTTRAEIEALGVSVDETAIANNGLIKTLNDIYEATERDSEAFARLIPEKRAFAAAMFLVEDSGKAAEEAISNIADIGPEGLDDLFGSKQQSNIAKWNAVVNQAGRITEEFGERFIPVVSFGIGVLERLLDVVDNLPGPLKVAAEALITTLVSMQATTKAAGVLLDGLLRVARIWVMMRLSMLAFNGTLAKVISGQMNLQQVIFAVTGTQITQVQATNASSAANAQNAASSVLMRGGILGVVQSLGVLIKSLGAATVATLRYIASGKLFSNILLVLQGQWQLLIKNGIRAAIAANSAWIKGQVATIKTSLQVAATNNVVTASFLKIGGAVAAVAAKLLLAVFAWKAITAAINAFRDEGAELREEMEAILETTGRTEEVVEQQKNFVLRAADAFFAELKQLFTQPILFFQEAAEKIFEPILKAINRIERLLGINIIPDEVVTNTEKAAANIQSALGDTSQAVQILTQDALGLAQQLKDGDLTPASEEVTDALERMNGAIAALEAQKADLADMDLPDEEAEKLNAQIDAQIDLLEAGRDRIKQFGDAAEDTDEQMKALNLSLKELEDALSFLEATGLPVERFNQLNEELDLTPDKLGKAIDLFYRLRDAGKSATEALAEIDRVLAFSDEQLAAFQEFIADSNEARLKRIRDEMAITQVYEDQIDALDDRNEEMDDFNKSITEANRDLEYQKDLISISAGMREEQLERENSLLELQIRDRQQIIEDENSSASQRRRAERELQQLARERKQNEIDRLRLQQDVAEQIFAAEQTQIDNQLKLEQIELRREQIKLRISALENKAAIAAEQKALQEAEQRGDVEGAERIREGLAERQDLAKEYERGMADLAGTMTDLAADREKQREADRRQFDLENERRKNELLDTVMGFGLDDQGTARERRRARRGQTEVEQELTSALYGRNRGEGAVQQVLQETLGIEPVPQGELTPTATTTVVQQGELNPENIPIQEAPVPFNPQPQRAPADMLGGQQGVSAIVTAINNVAGIVPSTQDLATLLAQSTQMMGVTTNPTSNGGGLAFGANPFAAVGG